MFLMSERIPDAHIWSKQQSLNFIEVIKPINELQNLGQPSPWFCLVFGEKNIQHQCSILPMHQSIMRMSSQLFWQIESQK